MPASHDAYYQVHPFMHTVHGCTTSAVHGLNNKAGAPTHCLPWHTTEHSTRPPARTLAVNCDRDANVVDTRSDNAGPEPEGLEVFKRGSKWVRPGGVPGPVVRAASNSGPAHPKTRRVCKAATILLQTAHSLFLVE